MENSYQAYLVEKVSPFLEANLDDLGMYLYELGRDELSVLLDLEISNKNRKEYVEKIGNRLASF